MKTIIAGSRNFADFELLKETIQNLDWRITQVVCGGAKGADFLGEQWAKANKIPIKYFHAKWGDLKAYRKLIRKNSRGKQYNALAGFNRNLDMARYADALLVFWDGKSTGTQDMISCAEAKGLKIRTINYG